MRLNIASASLTGGLIRSIRDNRSSMVLSAAADAGHALQDQVVVSVKGGSRKIMFASTCMS